MPIVTPVTGIMGLVSPGFVVMSLAVACVASPPPLVLVIKLSTIVTASLAPWFEIIPVFSSPLAAFLSVITGFFEGMILALDGLTAFRFFFSRCLFKPVRHKLEVREIDRCRVAHLQSGLVIKA